MARPTESTRREFLARLPGLGALATTHPARLFAQEVLPTRTIPVSGEALPIVGIGSTQAVLSIPTEGTAPIANVIRMLLEYGGRVVDTSPRAEEIDRAFGGVLQAPAV